VIFALAVHLAAPSQISTPGKARLFIRQLLTAAVYSLV